MQVKEKVRTLGQFVPGIGATSDQPGSELAIDKALDRAVASYWRNRKGLK